MAVTLRTYLNNALKQKGMTVKQAQKNAGKYKSISAAKKAGSLYYTNKDGKIMAAVFAEDLKKPIPKPKPKPKTKQKPKIKKLQGPTKLRGTLDEKVEVDRLNKKKKPMTNTQIASLASKAIEESKDKGRNLTRLERRRLSIKKKKGK